MLNINLNISYNFFSKKIIYFDEGEILCRKSEIDLLEDSPILIFNCLIETDDKKKLIKIYMTTKRIFCNGVFSLTSKYNNSICCNSYK